MEQQIRAKCFDLLSSSTATASTPPQQALILSLSLILNSSTSYSTLSSLFQTLTLSLHPNSHPLSLLPTLSLLSTLASHRPHLSRPIFDSIRSFYLLSTHTSPRTLAASLSVLASLAESDQTLVSELNECSGRLSLTLCFQTSVSVRRWTLLNAERLRIRPSLLLTVLLGFTRDPYPYLRGVALDGLVGLCKSVVVEDRELVGTCCRCAVELFGDMEDCVRCAAVRAVAQWGQLLVALNHDSNRKNLSNALFLQLCSMVRDMSLRVRVEAFDALGEISMVSEEILLRTLSKKPLSVSLQGSKPILQQCGLEQKTNSGLCSTKQFEIPASNAAGVFVHGLEDEFSEVRRSACHSLHTLSILSADFSCEALNLLMDALNDDSMVVRLQALETLRCMALFDRLKVQETHMHMFLSTQVDTSVMVRSAARKVLRIIKLEDVAIFKLSVDGLLENLQMYPQDGADVFSVLFSIGRHHGNFAADLIAGVSDEIKDLLVFLHEKLKVKQILQPPIIASILAMVIGCVPFLRRLVFTNDAPLYFLTDSGTILGKIQRSLWRDGGHGIRRSPRISALDAWKYSEEEEMEDHHQRPPSGTKRKLHQHGRESQNQEDNSTNSGQSSVMTPASFMPEKRILELVVDILQRRDTYEIFGEPVDPKEVEDYYEIIEEPMDFGTMRAKLHEELYKNLEQFEHDAFLIPRNAMHFNSTATVYFRQARAIYELAKKVFHVLKTDPENLESEFSLKRRRSCRRPQGEGKTLNFNSCRSVTTNVRTRSSLSGPSNLRRSNWGNPGFSSTANKRDYDFYPGVRDSRRSNIIEVDRRSTYRPLMSSENESDSIVSTVNSGPKLLVHANLGDISYRENLMMFARDLGPIPQMIANRKLKGWSEDSPVFQTPSSNSWGQTSVPCPFPTAFVSAQKGPTTLDTPITNPSGDFFDSLHGHCSEVESTPDIIDLTSADDEEKANTNNAFTGKCATNKKRARMGNHSSLVWKVATNNAGDTTGNNSALRGKVGFNNEESTRHESDWIKRFSISDSDNKIHEKEINKIHRSWFTSTSGTEELSSAATGISGTSTKSISLTLDSGKMDAQEQQATLASFSSQLSDQSELKLRNSNSSTTYPWPWHPVGDSKHEPVDAVKYKGGTNCSSTSQASYSAESNRLKPLASPFAFDLRFLKSRLNQMNSQNGSLQSQFQQGNDKEGPSSSQMRLSTQPSQLPSHNHQYSVWDTNLALKL